MIAATRDTDFVLLVTEPTPFGLHDLSLAVDAVRHLGIPCGIVENRAEDGNTLVRDFADKNNLPLLLSIPFDRKYAEAYSRGELLVEADPGLEQAFHGLWSDLLSLTNTEVAS